MSHRLPFPAGRTFLLHLALVIILASFSHCQKKEETPPPPKVQAPSTLSPAGQAVSACCRLLPAAGLKEGMGRLIVAFPDSAVPKATRVAVLKDTKEVQAGHGSQSWELPAGMYDVTISEKTLSGVAIQAGQDTQVKVGVLRVNAIENTRIELLDPVSGKVLASSHGERLYGLPIGPVSVQVAGRSETVTIEDGKVTEF